MKQCIYCGEEIHPMRLEILPHTKTCVKCSQEAPKGGRLVTYGTGEEIYTEVEVLERETMINLYNAEKDFKPNLNFLDEVSDEDDIDFDYMNSSDDDD